MGTLGCINDMLQRDKENRELRKLNKERMKEHHKYLVNKGKNINLSNISIETIEEIRKNTIAKEQSDQIYLFKAYIIFAICLLGLFLLGIGKSSVSCPLKPSDSAPLKHSTMPP